MMEFEYYLQLAIEEYLLKFGDDKLTVHLLYKLIARANELQNEFVVDVEFEKECDDTQPHAFKYESE